MRRAMCFLHGKHLRVVIIVIVVTRIMVMMVKKKQAGEKHTSS